MSPGRPPIGLSCPGCGGHLEPLGAVGGEVHRMSCPGCGGTYRARPRSNVARRAIVPKPVGGLMLVLRGWALRLLPSAYSVGLWAGASAMIAAGGFVLVIRRWMGDSVGGLGGIVSSMGGVRISPKTRDPDADFGPILRRIEAPSLFDEVEDVARRLGVRPPEEVRMAFLPCCGVVAWRRSRALLLGLPLLHTLSVAELRAILAHELAHLARGDATWAAGSLRFVEELNRSLDAPDRPAWGPLRAWALVCRRLAVALVGPIARGQEARADRSSASIAGSGAAASALIKVALVQPLFREVLDHHDPDRSTNLYASFRAFWDRLPAPLVESMRLGLLTRVEAGDSPHPPLPDRVAMIQGYPDRPDPSVDNQSATSLLGDPEWLEQLLHDRLFGLPIIEPTVFHRSGS